IALKIDAIERRAAEQPPPSFTWDLTRVRVEMRLDEVAKAYENQIGIYRFSRLSANFLSGAQYIIGGVLASSFAQNALTPRWVGILGVVVLIASLFQQQYHPDKNAAEARRKANRLKALIRSTQDSLAIIHLKSSGSQSDIDSLVTLMTSITK